MYIDAIAAEDTVHKGYSSSRLLCAVAGGFWVCAERHHIAVWIGRVPSALNPADSLSRGDFKLAHMLGAEQLPPASFPQPQDWEFLLEMLLEESKKSDVLWQ